MLYNSTTCIGLDLDDAFSCLMILGQAVEWIDHQQAPGSCGALNKSVDGTVAKGMLRRGSCRQPAISTRFLPFCRAYLVSRNKPV
jgi:hypothetical protein